MKIILNKNVNMSDLRIKNSAELLRHIQQKTLELSFSHFCVLFNFHTLKKNKPGI